MNKRISSEDLKRINISKEEIEEIKNFNEDFSDPECPPSTDEQLAQFRRSKDLHLDRYKTVGLE